MALTRLWTEEGLVLRAYLESADGPPVALVDAGGQVLECNAAFRELAGDAETLAATRFPALSAGEEADSAPRRITLQVGPGAAQQVAFHRVRCASGQVLFGERVLFTETRVVAGIAALHEELVNTTRELHKKNLALEEARANLRTLRGLLPICCSCKKIRDDQGYWEQIEVYVSDRTDADFTHSLCPDCIRTLYPDLELTP